jgi:uncharacterized protein YdaU (DUF1376 family)
MTRPGKNDTKTGSARAVLSSAEALGRLCLAVLSTEPQNGVPRYKPPYLPWYVKEFYSSSGVQQMSRIERYHYQTLLFRAWDCDTTPYLPNNDDKLWRLADCESKEKWVNEIKPIVIEQFRVTDSGNFLVNKRQYEEYCKISLTHDLKVARAGGSLPSWAVLSTAMALPSTGIALPGTALYPDPDPDPEPIKQAAHKSAKPKATPTPPPFDGAEFCERVAGKYPRDVKTAAGQIPPFLATLVMDEVCKWADISQGAEYLEKHVDEFAAWYKRLDTKKRAFIPGFEKFIREGIYKRGEDYWTEKLAGGSEFVDSKPVTKILQTGGWTDEEWEERIRMKEERRAVASGK